MRKRSHEDHTNHEAWAIPYGDLVTLLLALFVVLYSMSSVNEGKYRVLSDSLNEAFGGRPRSMKPIQVGDHPDRGANPALVNIVPKQAGTAQRPADGNSLVKSPLPSTSPSPEQARTASPVPGNGDLRRMADQIQQAMGDLIDKKLVTVRRTEQWLEIEIRTDLLFPSGVADVAAAAKPVLARVSTILKPFPNAIRIEGHTDNVPIATSAFPSNWQLSSARAASVVSLFMAQGVVPTRMSVAGFGEFYPAASNDTAEGRNRNRRVLVVVLAGASTPLTGADAEAMAAASIDDANPSSPETTSVAGPEAAAQPLRNSPQTPHTLAAAPVTAPALEQTP